MEKTRIEMPCWDQVSCQQTAIEDDASALFVLREARMAEPRGRALAPKAELG